jgi:hypothetical protein
VTPKPNTSYRRLDAAQIVETIALLQRRVEERFPGAGLANVIGELRKVADESRELNRWTTRANIPIRILSWVLAACILGLIIGFFTKMSLPEMRDMVNFTQFLEAALSAMGILGATIFFLVTYESRVKRQRILRAIHELRSIAHIVDMHQLTKDPDRYLLKATFTESSPKRTMTLFELGRYLDYCCDALALISKVAAMYVEGFFDEVALEAVDEIEALTGGLSAKISQKISVLNDVAERNESSGGGATG